MSGRSGRPRARAGESVRLELTKSQVDHVIWTATRGGRLATVLARLDRIHDSLTSNREWIEGRRLSNSLLNGLLLLAAFPRDASSVGNADIAREVNLNASTCHRYLATLYAVGLIDRDARTRKYRLARQAPSRDPDGLG